jgi:hypothetical protein
MIDVSKERLCPLAQATRHVPGNPHIATLHRWRLRGVKGVKLETVLVGGRRFTSVEAIARFMERLNGGRGSDRMTPARRQKEIEAAERELADAGI